MVSDYVYLGSYISSSEKDFLTRKGKAWAACNVMNKIWSSDLDNDFKLKIFKATVEPILLYGSETWTLSKKLEKRLDGTYTRLLMRVQNISWKTHPTKAKIYKNIPLFPALFKPVESDLLVTATEQSMRSSQTSCFGSPTLVTKEAVS